MTSEPEAGRTARSRRSPLIRLAINLVAAFVVIDVGLQIVLGVVQPDGGPIGLLGVVAQPVALLGLLAIPIAIASKTRRIWIALAALAVVAALRFGGDWISLPPVSALSPEPTITIATWNLEIRSRTADSTVSGLRGVTADVIVLQELTVEPAAAIDADAELATRYPYRLLHAATGVTGMGVLSNVPIDFVRETRGPIIQEVVLRTAFGPLRVVNVHPFPPHYGAAARGVEVVYDPSARNADLVRIRTLLDHRIGAGELVVLAGDTNTSASEPAFGRLMAGLHDAHSEVGGGPGWKKNEAGH